MQSLINKALPAIIFVTSLPAVAQMNHSAHMAQAAQPAPQTKADAALGDAQVMKIDAAKHTVTLKHGALPNGMPAMTMVYKVKDPAWLAQLKPSQKIRFATDPADGGMTVTKIELVK